MMYQFKLGQVHFGSINAKAVTSLHVLIRFAVLLGCLSIIDAWKSLPDPSSFPENLRSIYYDAFDRFKCDFNQGHPCEFSLGRGWSFHQSIKEFADKVKKAAEQTTSELRPETNVSRKNSHAQIVSPNEMDYFLCSVAGLGINANGFAPLQVRIPWPRFIPFSIPLAVTEVTTQGQTETRRVSTDKSKRGLNSGEIISHTITIPQDSSPVACMQLSLRFPLGREAQISLVFDSPLQVVKLEPETNGSKALSTYKSRTSESARLFVVPRNVWIVLTVPLFSFQATTEDVELSTKQNQSFLFPSQGLTWMSVVTETEMSIRASVDVCVDNFLIRPIAHVNGRNQTETVGTCFRGLTWRDSESGMNRTVLLDSAGLDATVRPTGTVRNGWDRRNHLEFVENGTFVGHVGWFRFSGALVLAICATLLFLLFTTTLCVSIALTRRRKSSSRIPLTSNRIVNSNSRNRVFRPTDYAEDSLLPRILKSKHEEETQSSGTEPVSTENGESLFQHDGNTCRSLVPEEGETEATDPMATSAMQLARNWFLYRNRGDRLRQRTHFGIPTTIPPPIIPYSPASPLTVTATSPCAPVEHPTDKAFLPSFMDSQIPRDIKPANAPAASYRHSLVLSVDDNDQLVILPSTQSITNSMHRAAGLEPNSTACAVVEDLSETEENGTEAKHSALPSMQTPCVRSRTIDSTSLSDISPTHLKSNN